MTSCQSQYDRIDGLALATASAFSDTALKPRPGGSINPFCEPATDTSTPQASCSYSIEPRPEMVSTISSAGCFVRSIALRTSSGDVTKTVDVSLCLTITALILCWRSAPRLASIASPSAPRCQSPGRKSPSSLNLSAMPCHSTANWPVSAIKTLSPGNSVLTIAASQAPVPDDGKMITGWGGRHMASK